LECRDRSLFRGRRNRHPCLQRTRESPDRGGIFPACFCPASEEACHPVPSLPRIPRDRNREAPPSDKKDVLLSRLQYSRERSRRFYRDSSPHINTSRQATSSQKQTNLGPVGTISS